MEVIELSMEQIKRLLQNEKFEVVDPSGEDSVNVTADLTSEDLEEIAQFADALASGEVEDDEDEEPIDEEEEESIDEDGEGEFKDDVDDASDDASDYETAG